MEEETEWSDCSEDKLLLAFSEIENTMTKQSPVESSDSSGSGSTDVFHAMEDWSGPDIDLKYICKSRTTPASLPECLMDWQQDWGSSDSEYLAEKSRCYKKMSSGIPNTDCIASDYCSSEDSFKPTQEMINSSDSESNLSLNIIDENSSSSDIMKKILPTIEKTSKAKERISQTKCKPKEKYQTKVNDAGEGVPSCRRKIKLSRKQRNKMSTNLVKKAKSNMCVDSTLKGIKQKSLRMEKLRQTIFNLHQRRLQILLKSNGLTQIPIAADGNCFMEAVSIQLEVNQTSRQLRQDICDHFSQNEPTYIHFFSSSDKTDEENHTCYQSQIEYLRTEGHWASNIADALPLAVSNMFHRPIQIYTSRPVQPIVEVQPSIGSILNKDSIKLTLIAAPGQDHYDMCQPEQMLKQVMVNNQNCKTQKCDITPKKQLDYVTDDSFEINDMDKSKQNEKTPKKLYKDILQQMTPRKQAVFVTPPKKKSTRKRQRNESQWKRNVRKQLRQSGKEYMSVKGRVVQRRQMKPIDCRKCRFKCSQKINESERLELFHAYWGLGCYERQRDFICSNVLEKESANRQGKVEKRKKVSRHFTFRIRGESVRVCKNFFISTLGITVKAVDYTLENVRNKFVPVTPKDRRGKKSPSNKTPRAVVVGIKKHIESFPTVSSHYTRKDSTRHYLSSELSITKMYELYCEYCTEIGSCTASFSVYRRIFCTEYNLSFHVPKKDQCELCKKYQQMNELGTLDSEMELDYNVHQERKVSSRLEKNRDKEKAKIDESFNVATFDLEAVLPTPCSLISRAYYKRKLNCYNFSIYSLGDAKGFCFLWNETEGKRGSCEVGTCLYLYLNSLPASIKHVCFYSDSCIGQNRNQYVTAALQHALLSSPNLQVIEQKFLEKGHTQMECDSMHAAVEDAKKKTPVLVPSQWDTVIRMARRKNPYTIIPVKHWDIIDFKKIARVRLQNVKTTITGEPVDWPQVKWIQLRKSEPDYLFFKHDIHEDFKLIKCKVGTRGRPETPIVEPPRMYMERLPISSQKKKDLLELCNRLVIPHDHHGYYKEIPSSAAVKDRLPQPDQQEEDVDSAIE